MKSDTNAGSPWERVAAELRACRDAQQRAWGDIDNTTLGRYLADEVTSEERQHIEGALDELPELRKLTELVRDVLGESEVAVSEPATVPYGPAILPFSSPQPRHEAVAQPTLSGERWQTPSAPRNWTPRPMGGRYRQRAGLVAAAGFLLALGVALPRLGGSTFSQPESPVALSQPLASRGDLSSLVVMANGKDMPFRMMGDGGEDNPRDRERPLAGIAASVQFLKAEGKTEEAETLARHYTNNLTRRAMFYRQKGDLARAEPALNQAQELCAQTLGLEAPETVRARKSLARVYEVALNTAPADNPDLLGTSAKFADAAQPPRLMARSLPAPVATQPSAVENAPGRGSPASAVRITSSGYGSPSPASKKRERSNSPQRGKKSMHHAYGAYPPQQPREAQQTGMLALRERITCQSQSALKTSVVPVLTQALRDATDPVERQRLARALGQLGSAARTSVPDLLACYHKATSDPERSAILHTLGRIGPAARQALPILVDSLQNPNTEVRESAAAALVQLGPAARYCEKDLAKQGANDSFVHEVMRRINGPEGRIGIDDECDCFSLKTIHHEKGEIRRLAVTYNLEILVETVANQGLERIDKTGDRKIALGRSSVYLRINKDAGDVQVHVSDALRKQGLTDAHLRQVLEPYLKNKQYDRALHAGVHFLAQFEKEHSKK